MRPHPHAILSTLLFTLPLSWALNCSAQTNPTPTPTAAPRLYVAAKLSQVSGHSVITCTVKNSSGRPVVSQTVSVQKSAVVAGPFSLWMSKKTNVNGQALFPYAPPTYTWYVRCTSVAQAGVAAQPMLFVSATKMIRGKKPRPSPTATPIPTATATPTPRPTMTPVPTVTPTATPRPTATATPLRPSLQRLQLLPRLGRQRQPLQPPRRTRRRSAALRGLFLERSRPKTTTTAVRASPITTPTRAITAPFIEPTTSTSKAPPTAVAVITSDGRTQANGSTTPSTSRPQAPITWTSGCHRWSAAVPSTSNSTA